MLRFTKYCGLALILNFVLSCARSPDFQDIDYSFAQEGLSEELAAYFEAQCVKATPAQISQVNAGNSKRIDFLRRCINETGSQKWCEQVARPNPDSRATFVCTYSPQQPAIFVHPDESTWKYAITAVQLVLEMERRGIGIFNIYNWWRPEPYNQNVGGAAGRHPFGTSIDVRFNNKTEQNKAHSFLCQARRQGRLRALGYYSGTGLHLGVGDRNPNTWGRDCP